MPEIIEVLSEDWLTHAAYSVLWPSYALSIPLASSPAVLIYHVPIEAPRMDPYECLSPTTIAGHLHCCQ